MKNFATGFGIVGIIILAIILIGIGPVLTILALNTLFLLTIPINIWTWLSVVWLGAFFTVAAKGK